MHVAKKTHAAHSVSTLRTVDRDSVGAQITTAAHCSKQPESAFDTRQTPLAESRHG
jgi:hypothetical protein